MRAGERERDGRENSDRAGLGQEIGFARQLQERQVRTSCHPMPHCAGSDLRCAAAASPPLAAPILGAGRRYRQGERCVFVLVF